MTRTKTAPVVDVTASSFYKSEAFGPANLIDGDRRYGGWISDAGQCDTAWVAFHFSEAVIPVAVEICNGFIEEAVADTRDDYYFHKRARDITLSFEPGGPAALEITLKDIKEPQMIALTAGTPTKEAVITIRSVYDASPDGTIRPFDVVGLRHVSWMIR